MMWPRNRLRPRRSTMCLCRTTSFAYYALTWIEMRVDHHNVQATDDWEPCVLAAANAAVALDQRRNLSGRDDSVCRDRHYAQSCVADQIQATGYGARRADAGLRCCRKSNGSRRRETIRCRRRCGRGVADALAVRLATARRNGRRKFTCRCRVPAAMPG